MRRDLTNYYLDIAETVTERSTCLKRHYGAVIVSNTGGIISTGYNGSPKGLPNCVDCGKCYREGCPRGTGYENCVSVHAEQNAIMCCDKDKLKGSTLYLVGVEPYGGDVVSIAATELFGPKYVENPDCCSLCKRMIINSGIKKVIIRLSKNEWKCIEVKNWTIEDIVGGY